MGLSEGMQKQFPVTKRGNIKPLTCTNQTNTNFVTELNFFFFFLHCCDCNTFILFTGH